MSNKVYALLATGDIVEGIRDPSKPRDIVWNYGGGRVDTKEVPALAEHTPENYSHLVALFGENRVPKPDITNETSLAYLRKHGKAIGRVSDKSSEDARGKGQYFVVELGSDGETFVVGRDAWKYCVLYNSILQEIKPQPKKPPIKAGDYVMGVSSDLENISAEKYIVVDNGVELVVFDDSDVMLPIIEQIEMGYFKQIEKE